MSIEHFVQRAEDCSEHLSRSKQADGTDSSSDKNKPETFKKWLLYFKGNKVVFESINRTLMQMWGTI